MVSSHCIDLAALLYEDFRKNFPFETVRVMQYEVLPTKYFSRYCQLAMNCMSFFLELFWKYLIHNLKERFSKRNYDRSIDVPKFVMPDVLIKFVDTLKGKIVSHVMSEYEVIKDELSNFEGIMDDVAKKEEEIAKRLKSIIAGDEELQSIFGKVQELTDEIETDEQDENNPETKSEVVFDNTDNSIYPETDIDIDRMKNDVSENDKR